METKHIIVIVTVIAVLVILCGVFAFGFMNQNKNALEIDDINVVKDQYGIYSLKGHISPLKDFSYLEARIVFYDDSGAIIGKAPCAWNMLDIKKGSTVSVGNGMGAVCDGNPAYAVVSFYNDVRSDNPIVNATVRFSQNNTANSTDTTVSTSNNVVKNDNDDNKKFSQEDMDRARDEGYWNGYSDSYQDQYQHTDDSNVETTTDDSSSSSNSRSSSSSNVETTRG